ISGISVILHRGSFQYSKGGVMKLNGSTHHICMPVDNKTYSMVQDNQSSTDPYLKTSFSFKNKLRRFIWSIVWQLLCRWNPKPLHGWRVLVLRSFGAKIGKKNFVYPSCRIWAPWLLMTEDIVTIGPNVEIYNP